MLAGSVTMIGASLYTNPINALTNNNITKICNQTELRPTNELIQFKECCRISAADNICESISGDGSPKLLLHRSRYSLLLLARRYVLMIPYKVVHVISFS